MECRKAHRYIDEMDYPIYSKMNLSKRIQQAKVCRSLLRNAIIEKQIKHGLLTLNTFQIKWGFLYLTAVID